jgi:ferritin-like metal-binding protein YciE
MPDPNERDAKLIQYMQEAYGNEQALELSLQADILITTKAPYQKRLKQHLKETKAHAKALERRIKKLGGGTTLQKVVGKATAAAKAPLHAVRGSGEAEKMLKNAKDQFTAEQAEISTYLALEVFATKVNDKETAKLARDIRRDEERMARFLESQVRQLAGAVATAEVPAAQRRAAGKKRRSAKRSTAKKPAAKGKAKSKSSAKKATAKKSTARKSTARKSTARKSPAKKSPAKKAGAKKSTGSKSRKAKAKRSTRAKSK